MMLHSLRLRLLLVLSGVVILIMALFGYVSPSLAIISFVLFGLVILLIGFGAFLLPSGISTATGWGFRKMGHNYWRLIPNRGVMLIRISAIYGFGSFFVAVLFVNTGNSMAGLVAITGLLITVYGFHSVGYWYHSPAEIREGFISMFKSRKHLKRHRKHNQE